MRNNGVQRGRAQIASSRDVRIPFVLPYLDLIVLLLVCWFFRDWLINHVEPLATFVVQEMGDPFGWLVPLPIAAPAEPMPIDPIIAPQPGVRELLV